MAGSSWTEEDLPDLTGRRAVVTGASSGIGLEASRQLAAVGVEVVLAVRDPERGRRAAEEIVRTVAAARLAVAEIDLSELASVRRFARREAESGAGSISSSTTRAPAAVPDAPRPTATRSRWRRTSSATLR